ncbi:MAG: MFS transporter, partial [Candidatus Helarchaeota archaeon]|nr:MFS transporter [Candidatus Helarchaeota archaeon]
MDDEYERKRRLSFLYLFLIYAALFICRGILPANLDLIRISLDTTRPAIAWLMAIDLLVLIISILFFGYFGEKLSEKYSIKKIFIITQLSWVACFGLFVFAQNFLQFSILHVLSAVFRGAYLPIAFAMVGDFYPPKERGSKFGMINVGLIIGAGGGLLFGALLGN